MTLTYEECQFLTEWINSLNPDPDAIPDNVRPLLERINKLVSAPESP